MTPLAPLQAGGLLATPLGKLLVAVVALGVVVLVGRLVLRVAWRLITIAAVVLGALLLLSMFAPGLIG
jgi:hypothetical protein